MCTTTVLWSVIIPRSTTRQRMESFISLRSAQHLLLYDQAVELIWSVDGPSSWHGMQSHHNGTLWWASSGAVKQRLASARAQVRHIWGLNDRIRAILVTLHFQQKMRQIWNEERQKWREMRDREASVCVLVQWFVVSNKGSVILVGAMLF